MNVGKLHPGGCKHERRATVFTRLGRRGVDDVEQDANPDEAGVEVDVEAREALGRFVGEHECGEEGEKLTGRCAGFEHAVAAVNQGACDGEAAECLHHGARAIGDARPFVRFQLEGGNIGLEPLTHDILQRKRLDDTDTLYRLLHGFEDARAAGELVFCNAVDAADHLAQNDECRRHDNETEQRHYRVLPKHHRDEADQQEQIAAERGKNQVEHLACRIRARGYAREEIAGMPFSEEA